MELLCPMPIANHRSTPPHPTLCVKKPSFSSWRTVIGTRPNFRRPDFNSWREILSRKPSFSSWLVIIGIVLLGSSLGQYGYMAWGQRHLRQQWNAINTPSGSTQPATSKVGGLRLIIPSIQLDDAVIRGTTYEDLLVAPGLLEGSPLPDAGGNTVIAGHRDTFFRHVADLQPGAEIRVRSGGTEYDYQVTKREIVKPTQTSVLDSTPHPQLTL